MLLKEALEIHKKSHWKIDILETLWIEIKNDYLNEKFYQNKIKNLPKWNYFLSDLDWTFFRWTLIQEAFSIFAKYLRCERIEKVDLEEYKKFLEDLKFFKDLEKKAYNKKISFNDYLNAWLFLIYKYSKQVNWEDFLVYLKEYFYRQEKVNPFRFSINKMTEVLKRWDNFLFISWASSFVFEIYLELLKEYVAKNIWEEYTKQVHWISSYPNFEEKYTYNLWNMQWKYEFITELKKQNFMEKITWWMWDTASDFGISNHLYDNNPFYFINPAYWVVNWFEELANKNIDFHFIVERKDIIFEYKLDSIDVLN